MTRWNHLKPPAVSWLMVETTGSTARTGPGASSLILPIRLASLVGDEMVVRLGYKRTSVGADPTSGGTVAPTPLLCAARLLEF